MTSETSPAPPPGYHGCYLRIDLSRGSSQLVPLEAAVLRQSLGGSGLGVQLLLREQAATTEPLSPESSLAFVFSPLVGSPLTTSAKFAVVSKSPLTERINDSLASSGFALAGKKTGCDAIVITGRAAKPSVLVIDDGCVRVESADDVWGTSIDVAQGILRARFARDYSCAVIGPAGERRVRYATISHDGRHAGRGGSGAVLGAKNVKAVVVRGSQRCLWAKPHELVVLAKRLSEKSFGPATAKYRELGTAANLLVFNRLRALPTQNFRRGSFAGAMDLAPETLAPARERTRVSCAACTIGCEHIYAVGQHAERGVRVEYENLFALGPLCGISDPDVVLTASRRCDELGLDTISLGGTVAFAMECVERGLLDVPWLKFGDGAALLRAVEETGHRVGVGDRLAEGSRRLAAEIGQDAIDFAPQVKGLELPGYEPRALQTMALGFAVGTRGADHNRSSAYEVDFSERVDRRQLTPQAVVWAIEAEDKAALIDSLILCKFLRGVFVDFFAEAAEMLRLVTGWDVTPEELRNTAKQLVTAKKWFNIQAGWTPAEDTLPARFFDSALEDDASARLTRAQLAEAIREYNLQRGWTADGWLAAPGTQDAARA
ncbi:MAG: aldehyde ferredoxin oxidoreductase family protein [Planctomycetota bacterium]|nr:aldehyde ferredoxin oxidoreductase family protein [Planctomycetota bacterium]